MRTATLCLALAASVTVSAWQDKTTSPPEPKKGDTVYVKGCLDGSALVSTEIKVEDTTGELASALTFRLTGEKDALKKLRQEHDGHVVEVTGILKSNLPKDGGPGVQVGKTRVHIGIASPQPGSPMQQTTQSLPVLEVKSYEGSATTCKG
jgi:hypothetical protein